MIDWRGQPGLCRPGGGFGAAGRPSCRAAGRGSTPAGTPTGLLTHHLVHDTATWRFLENLQDWLAQRGRGGIPCRHPPVAAALAVAMQGVRGWLFMLEFRYPLSALVKDYLLGSGPRPLPSRFCRSTETGTGIFWFFVGLAAFFLIVTANAANRHVTRITVSEDGIASRPLGVAVSSPGKTSKG